MKSEYVLAANRRTGILEITELGEEVDNNESRNLCPGIKNRPES